MSNTFGSRVKLKRSELHLTQKDLERKTDINQSRISSIESERAKDINLIEAAKIAEALAVSIDWLYYGDESSKPITPLQWFQYTKELTDNPPGYISHPIPAPGPNIPEEREESVFPVCYLSEDKKGSTCLSFSGADMKKFFEAYFALHACLLDSELLNSMISELFKRFECFFTPGSHFEGNMSDGIMEKGDGEN